MKETKEILEDRQEVAETYEKEGFLDKAKNFPPVKFARRHGVGFLIGLTTVAVGTAAAVITKKVGENPVSSSEEAGEVVENVAEKMPF